MPHPADALPASMLVHRDLPYVSGGHPRQVLDLYLPRAAGPLPLIVWIHGGAFRMRSKEDHIRTHLLHERGLDPATMVTRGYWKLGAVDYTDHDYGTDS